MPWDYKMQNGRTLWADLCYHYEEGVNQVREFQKVWDKAGPYVDMPRFMEVQQKIAGAGNEYCFMERCLPVVFPAI